MAEGRCEGVTLRVGEGGAVYVGAWSCEAPRLRVRRRGGVAGEYVEVAAEAAKTVARLLKGEVVEAQQTFLAPILEEHGSCAPPRTSGV